jgi:hypothetical protein
MKEKIILETIGTVEKKATLAPVGDEYLVLEVVDPFPGYAGRTIKNGGRPGSLYCITRSKYIDDKIIRITQKIKAETKLKYDGTPGVVTLYDMLNPCVRLKDAGSYEEMNTILRYYIEEGIEFMSYRKIESYTGILKVRKYFLLEPISEDIYVDLELPNVYYFTIPIQMRFAQFEKITADVKKSSKESNFDAALVTFYRRTGLLDLIRVYDEKNSPDEIEKLRKKYIVSIQKFLK